MQTWAGKVDADDIDVEDAFKACRAQWQAIKTVVDGNHADDTENYPSPGLDEIVQGLAKILEGHVGPAPTVSQFEGMVTEGLR